MTPEERVKHYIGWHVAAYGAPAPEDEIVGQLVQRHGMNDTQATYFILEMLQNQEICFVRQEHSGDGYVLKEHMTEAA
jgi:hypothetical protein